MSYIKVWCEYDFSGNFGGNNNEEVFAVGDDLSMEDIHETVGNYLSGMTFLSKEDLEGLWGWEFIEVKKFK